MATRVAIAPTILTDYDQSEEDTLATSLAGASAGSSIVYNTTLGIARIWNGAVFESVAVQPAILGSALQIIRVNASGTALEFASLTASVAWGGITGTLSDQIDLQNALNLKAALISPTFTTPILGVATATTYNKVTITAPASSAVLTIADGVTLTVSANTVLTGTPLSNPMTTLGDTIYGGASGVATRLAGDTSDTRKFIRILSVAGVSTVPVWDTVTATDVGLGNVTNESKATMFTSPTFTGNAVLGTPASGTLTNCTFPTLNQNTSGSAASLSISGQTGLLTFTGLASTNRAKTVRDAADTILELGGSYTPSGTWTSMVLITPALGVATGTSFNGLIITTTTGTLTMTNGKTLSVSNSLTLAGTDATVITFPTTSATLARTDAANTFTGIQTFSSAPVFSVGIPATEIPNGIRTSNTAEQSQVVVSATNYYITNSALTMPAAAKAGMVVGTKFVWDVYMTKTAAGTGIFQISIYRGTNGSTSDTQDVLQTIGTQTAAVDSMHVRVTLYVTTTGASGAYFWTITPINKAVTATGFGVATGTTGYFSGTISAVAMNTASLKFGLGFKATTGTPTIRVVSVEAQAYNMD